MNGKIEFGRAAPAIVAALAVALCACTSLPERADPRSDAPEHRAVSATAVSFPASYGQALRSWHAPDDVNAWIGSRFVYDTDRAMRLSETQRARGPSPAILAPEDFYAAPHGICVDLSRFAVETLRAVAPDLKPAYVMIEFDPVSLGGNTLRRHWVASFERGGQRYFFADSKRPGHIAGPYGSTREYLEDYAAYRGRAIVAFRELDTFMRRAKAPSAQSPRPSP